MHNPLILASFSIALFFALFSTPTSALSPAPSISCCYQWSQTGVRPDVCEPRQTEYTCERELNHPEPQYLLSCWPNTEDPQCRANVDANIAKTRLERQQLPIDIEHNGLIEGHFIPLITRYITLFGLLGFVLGVATTFGILTLRRHINHHNLRS